jgi:CubicO group peptidase (beta-lactamase class C family)
MTAVLLAGCTATGAPPVAAAELAAKVDETLASAPDYARVRAILVTVDGKRVFEMYRDAAPEDYRNVASVTKSVMSTLVGIAAGQGRLAPEDTLAELLPEYRGDMSASVRRTTLRQVLTMTGGFPRLDADLDPRAIPEDWTRAVLRGQEAPPGTAFVYSDPGAHLVSAILEQATGQRLLDFARVNLFDPLGIVTRPDPEIAQAGTDFGSPGRWTRRGAGPGGAT